MIHMKKSKFIFMIVCIAVIILVLVSSLTYHVTVQRLKAGEIYLQGQDYETLKEYFELDAVQDIILAHYVEEIGESDLVKGTLSGMVKGLGDHSSAFYTQEEYRNFEDTPEDTHIAEGMLLGYAEEATQLQVIRVFPDTPAYEAGIKAGDIILNIDNKDTKAMDIDIAIGYLRGADGTTVTLNIMSGQEVFEIQLTRKSPIVQLVYTDMLDEKVGYINIVEFSGTVVEDFTKAIEEMKNENAEYIIIDIRNVSGGAVKQMSQIADTLLPAGEVTHTIAKSGENAKWESDDEVLWDKPVGILTGNQTADIAEVFAASLQERGRATILGEKTLGRAVETTIYKIESSGNAVKLVTARYYTPEGGLIDGLGVAPDVVIEGNVSPEVDEQLESAAEYMSAQS